MNSKNDLFLSCFPQRWTTHIDTEEISPNVNKGCVTLVALPFTLKNIWRQKEELWKLNYFTMQKYNL